MKKLFVLSFAILSILISQPSEAATLVIPGPTLTNNISGWDNAGLSITALQNVSLSSFVFNNQGQNDTIWLTTPAGTILQTIVKIGGATAPVFSPGWALTSGTTYHLIHDSPNNGRWVLYNGFPTSNAHLRVNGTWGGNQTSNIQTEFWFTFTQLTTDDGLNGGGGNHVVPEPATMLLMGSGLIGGVLLRRKRS